MLEQANRELIVRHFEEIFNRGNMAFVDEAYTDDAVIHDAIVPEIPPGPSGVRKYLRTYAGPVPDIHFEVLQLVADGDIIAAQWTASGTHKGTLLSLPPTGRHLEAQGVSIYRMEDGRIAEAWNYWDVIAMLRSMRVELKLKQAEAQT